MTVYEHPSMNILALNWNDLANPQGGGAEVQLEEMLRRLVTNGHTVTLFCSGWPGCLPEETIEGIRIVRRGNRHNFNFIAPFHLRNLAASEQFDILLEDINKIPFYTPLYLKMKRLLLIPHLFATTVFHETNFVLGSYVYLAEKPLVPVYRGSKYTVPSESTADDLVARGVPRDDIQVINNGLNPEQYVYDPSVAKSSTPTILYLGRVKKYKSIQHIIQALIIVRQKLPDAKLTVIGAGDYLPALQKLAASLGLADAVEFTGFVSQEEKVDRLRRAHVAVLPSIREGWGLTNIEANSVGTTVIAADAPGLRDSVRDGVSGFLFPYGDISALADKLCLVLTDSEVRQRLEAGAREWSKNFTWDRSARELEQLMLSIVESAT